MKLDSEEQITVRLLAGQKKWLYNEADRQCSNSSAIVRQAIKLLQEKLEKEDNHRTRGIHGKGKEN